VVWNLVSGEQYLTLENIPIITMHFTQDSTKLVTTDWNNLRVWEIDTRQEIYSLTDVCNPVLSPDFTMTATTDCDWSGIITLHDGVFRQQFLLGQQNSLILEMAFSPDGNLLAAWDNDENIGLWGLIGNAPDSILRSGDYDIAYPTIARFSPDGTILASWNERGDTIHLWSVATSEHVAALGGHHVAGSAAPGGSTLAIAFSPAAALLASFWGDYDDTEDKNLRLWDAATGNLLLTLPNEFSATFSPDGTMLATDSYDGTIKIWAVSADFS
jgi:WD40 repeat protein